MSDTERRTSTVIDAKLLGHVRRNRDLYADLPHPDVGEWVTADHFPEHCQQVACLHNMGVIEHVGRKRLNRGRNDRSYRRVWQTKERVYHELEERGYLNPDRPPLYGDGTIACPNDDCERVKLKNLDGERIKCKVCGTVAPKAEWRGGSDE